MRIAADGVIVNHMICTGLVHIAVFQRVAAAGASHQTCQQINPVVLGLFHMIGLDGPQLLLCDIGWTIVLDPAICSGVEVALSGHLPDGNI